MADLIDSAAWTGIASQNRQTIVNKRSAFGLPIKQGSDVAVMEKPVAKAPEKPAEPERLTYKPSPAKLDAHDPKALREYVEVAQLVGVAPPDLVVEEFKLFLIENEFTVYSRATVVEYMDKRCKVDGAQWGWQWKPLREKDKRETWFGTAPSRSRATRWITISGDGVWSTSDIDDDAPADGGSPASDYYTSDTRIYDKPVPLHALKKVAAIEKGFKHPVSFMVTDYAPAPAFKADPFLMALVPNANLSKGEGRFIIDFWDEPGFGIEQMLKSDLA